MKQPQRPEQRSLLDPEPEAPATPQVVTPPPPEQEREPAWLTGVLVDFFTMGKD